MFGVNFNTILMEMCFYVIFSRFSYAFFEKSRIEKLPLENTILIKITTDKWGQI